MPDQPDLVMKRQEVVPEQTLLHIVHNVAIQQRRFKNLYLPQAQQLKNFWPQISMSIKERLCGNLPLTYWDAL